MTTAATYICAEVRDGGHPNECPELACDADVNTCCEHCVRVPVATEAAS